MVLESRTKYSSSENFRDIFIETITPGVIERINFIQWDTIFTKSEKYNIFFNFFSQIEVTSKKECVSQLADALMSADVAMDFIKSAFELLGHTGKNYVSNEDYIDFKLFSKAVKDETSMMYISEVLFDLGLFQVLKLNIEDYFIGVQVGLETHRRKNGGGEAFSIIVNSELHKLIESLKNKGMQVELTSEETIYFNDGVTSKRLDFCLRCNGKVVGIEINFYTSPGSKPTEIKRSYGHINKELEQVGALLVWVTDGIGYSQMKKSLKEAVDIHKNTYNLNMFKKSFEDDVIDYFKS